MIELTWHIGDVVRKVRERCGLTRGDLADLAEPPLRPNTLGQFEEHNADYDFKQTTLTRIVTALNRALAQAEMGAEVTAADLHALVPVPRGSERPVTLPVMGPTDPYDVRMWEVFQRLSPEKQAAVRLMVDQLASPATATTTTTGSVHGGSGVE